MTFSDRVFFSSCTLLLLSSYLTNGSATGSPVDGEASSSLIRPSEHDSLFNRRSLALGDFAHFNELFADAKVDLGTHELGGSGASLTIENLFCSNVVIGDIQTSHSVIRDTLTGNDVLEYAAVVQPFSIDCEASYSYRLIGFPGGGTVTASAARNELETRVHLLSPSTFANEPPTSSLIDYCLGTINTNGNVNFQGDFIGDVLNVFRDQVSDLIDQLAAKGTSYTSCVVFQC